FIAQLPPDRPMLGPIEPEFSADEGAAVSFVVTATPTGPDRGVRFALAPGAPAGATIDALSGAFSWWPPDGPLDAVITVTAADAETTDRVDSRTFTVHVANLPPVVEAGVDDSLSAGQALV